MSRVCMLTGKRPGVGNTVSHSQRKVRRRFLPNLVRKTITDPVTGLQVRVRISTKALRTLRKWGMA